MVEWRVKRGGCATEPVLDRDCQGPGHLHDESLSHRLPITFEHTDLFGDIDQMQSQPEKLSNCYNHPMP